MAIIIDGKKTAQEIRAKLKIRVEKLREKGVTPGLSVTLVGENAASKVYVSSKDAAAREIGMSAWTHKFPSDVSEI